MQDAYQVMDNPQGVWFEFPFAIVHDGEIVAWAREPEDAAGLAAMMNGQGPAAWRGRRADPRHASSPSAAAPAYDVEVPPGAFLPEYPVAFKRHGAVIAWMCDRSLAETIAAYLKRAQVRPPTTRSHATMSWAYHVAC